MKKFTLLLLIIAAAFNINNAFAQSGVVYTVAGGTGTSTAEGVPATTARVYSATGIAVDPTGNIYYAERLGNKIRKVDITGNVYTIAGNGTSGYSGDGGPATNANISFVRGICLDRANNIYLADEGNNLVRKVDAATGIITTIAGGGTSFAEGAPATSSAVQPQCVFADPYGNIYTGSGNRVRKIDGSTGTITTVAGSTSGIISGDGGPATNAGLSGSAKSITMDGAGNIYIIDNAGDRIRKVDGVTRIISTVAGGGSGYTEGAPATSVSFWDFHNCSVDAMGNIFIADWNAFMIRKVDAATGIITTIAGGGTSYADGIPATAAHIAPYMIYADPVGSKIYYSDFTSRVRSFSYTPIYAFPGTGTGYTADSFSVYIHKQCSGPDLTLRTAHYYAGMTIVTNYGDGTEDTAIVNSAYSGIGGYALSSHTYPGTGNYPIRHDLYNGTTFIDSFSYMYNHTYCVDAPVKFYLDADGDCSKDLTEPFVIKPILTEIDSNGVAIDTISSTSGFNYTAYGNPGDIYDFKVISSPPGFSVACPSTGIASTTLPAVGYSNPTSWFGLRCATGTTFDLGVNSYVPVTGPNDQWGHIYLGNSYCFPVTGTATLTFSPKYIYSGGARPAPVSTTSNSLTWNVAALSGSDAAPADIYYVLWHNPATGYLIGGDTVHEDFVVTPTTGDAFIANNNDNRVDTVKTSCDPNAIEVLPAACFPSDTQLRFTVHFENTGNDTADNIYVLDTLSGNLDASSLRILMSSHNMFLSKSVVSGQTILKFNFPNIKLLDSSHHGECDGTFMYTINTMPGLPTGANIFSRVGIYFDYNDVVMTNTVQNTKGCPPPPLPLNLTNSNKTNVTLYPNPATDELTIKTATSSYTSLTISNSIGQVMMQQTISNTQTKVNVKALPAGLYYVTVKGENGNSVQKFVKL